jgi:hypothetical protein
MTLILSCITEDAVYQVSDRQLTDPRTGFLFEDACNKAVFVDGRVAFGYTGLGAMGNQPTDVWLAHTIAGAGTDMAAKTERVRQRAHVEVRRLPLPGHLKRHAFQGVGWFRLRPEGWLSPGLIWIHNTFDHQTGEFLSTALPEFRVASFFPFKLPGGYLLKHVGFDPTQSERSAVCRLIHKAVRHRRSTLKTVMDGLILSFRWLSTRHPDRIGASLMALCLPRRSVELFQETHRLPVLMGPPDDTAATFVYISSTGSKVSFGPIVVMGGTVLSNFRHTPV